MNNTSRPNDSLIAQIQAAANDYSVEFLQDIVPLLIEAISGSLAELERSLEANDQEGARMAAHRCKGDCNMAGLTELGELCRTAEHTIKDGQLETAKQLLPQLTQLAQAAEAELRAYIDS